MNVAATGPVQVNINSPITYTYTIRNGGTATGTNTTVTQPIPTGTTFASVSAPTGAVCTTPAVGASSGNVVCNFGALPPGVVDTFTVTVTSPAAATNDLPNGYYYIAADNTPLLVGPKVDTKVVSSATYADLGLTINDGVPAVAWGSTTTYQVVISNAGPSESPAAVIGVPLPTGGASATWSCQATSGTASVVAGHPSSGTGALNTEFDLKANSSETCLYQLTLNATGTSPSYLSFAGSVADATTVDPNPANNSAQDQDEVTTLSTLVDVTAAQDPTGSGAGVITSAPLGIDCGTSCSDLFASGVPITLNANVGSGSVFAGWSGVTCSQGQSSTQCTFTPSSNTTATAKFNAQTFTVSTSVTGNGTLSCPSTPNQGSDVSCTVTPAAGSMLSSLTDNGANVASQVSAGGTYDILDIQANHTLVAAFTLDTYSITATAGANGAISPSGAQTVSYGGSQAFTITPAAGYHVSDVEVDGASVGAVTSYTFSNVAAAHTINANFAINTYTLTPSAGNNGSISPAVAQTVNYGGSQTFSMLPATGYQVAGVLVDGVSVGAVGSYTFSSVAASHTISVSFAPISFTITPSAGANGSISPGTAQTVSYGGSQTFSITPATGYGVASVTVDGVSVGPVTSYTFSNVTASHAIAATFAINTYTITPGAGANGSISPATVQTVSYGGSQTFTMTPASGYHVASVLVDGASVGAVSTYTFSNVAASHTITATFAINTYTLTPSAGSNGSISPAAVQTVNSGGGQTFTMIPATGYQVSSVLVDGVSVGAVTSYAFSNVTASHTISVSFALTTFTITPTAGPNGSISPATAQTVNYGGSQTFNITPATGYSVASVTVDGTSIGAQPSYTFSNVTASHTISATFSLNTYTITPAAGANGSISPATAQTVNYGGSQTFTITPNTGYQVAAVLVDGVSVGAPTSYTFSNVAASHTITATFSILTYTLTPSAGANGSISPAAVQTVNYGGGQTFTIIPASGYHVADVQVDGVSVGAVSTYAFTNVTASHTISATFAINTYTLTPSAGPNGSITPATAQTVNSGANQTFTIAPASGYHINSVLVDGASIGTVTSYAFTNVTASHTISATFAITCNQDSDCSAGNYCDTTQSPHQCVPTLGSGVCTRSTECTSGNCVDGVCCNVACNGQCQACDVAGQVGTCTTVTSGEPHGARPACAGNGTVCGGSCDGTSATACDYPGSAQQCGSASCTNGTATPATSCAGNGSCAAPAPAACGNYTCESDGGTTCNTNCQSDNDCANSAWCNGGACTPKGTSGSATTCTSSDQCQSGNCVDGYCCDTACNGQCQACDIAGSQGTCTAESGGLFAAGLAARLRHGWLAVRRRLRRNAHARLRLSGELDRVPRRELR